jgi:hypothetical protein
VVVAGSRPRKVEVGSRPQAEVVETRPQGEVAADTRRYQGEAVVVRQAGLWTSCLPVGRGHQNRDPDISDRIALRAGGSRGHHPLCSVGAR